jgi:putative hydrolase
VTRETSAGAPGPVEALREIAFWLDRAGTDARKAQAFRRSADIVAAMDSDERRTRTARAAWSDVPGLGPSSVAVIVAAAAGDVPLYLARVRTEGVEPLTRGGRTLLPLLRGDCHTHTHESDGSASLEEMASVAATLGRDYLVVTDHSPRLTVARGLSEERLLDQGVRIDAHNETGHGVRLLKGIEVDILDDGSLDQTPSALATLDLVVASVHSRLQMDAESMTHRMVMAIANPRTNVLGHCTGRLVTGGRGHRAESRFDAEVVFEACRTFDVAVEINSRPERRDPPTRLLDLARDMGCLFSIDTDAHAPGQLSFLEYGAERAEAAGIPPERIITTWSAAQLTAWARRKL